MQKTPLQQVQQQFKDKAGLVSAVRALATKSLWLDRLSEDKGLEHVSNTKLLHLHGVLTAVKAEFGSRDKLIAAIVEKEGRSKDADYKNRFGPWPTPRLWDYYRKGKKTASAAASAPAKKKPAKKKPAKKKAKAAKE